MPVGVLFLVWFCVGGVSARYPGGWSYVVSPLPDGTAAAVNASTGDAEFIGPPSSVLNSAIAALPRGGGTVFLTRGRYIFDAPVVVDRSSVEVRGESAGGDLFFTEDGWYNGVSNKTATTIVAEGFDAFQVGNSAECRTPCPGGGYYMNGTKCLVFGVSFADLAISGVATEGFPHNWTAGAGVHVQKCDTLRFDNVEVLRKQWGIKLGQDPAHPFAYDRVIDVVTMNNIYLAYNQYGLHSSGWVCNVRIRNIFGYINQASMLWLDAKYDWLVDGVMSQADGNHPTGPGDAPVFIGTRQDFTMRHVTVASNNPTAPLIYVALSRAGDTSGEWYRGHVKLDTLTLFGTATDAVRVSGEGFVDIHNIHAGPTGDQSFYGGPGTIGRHIVHVDDHSDADV
eukprot:gene2346-3172_t